MDIKIEETDKLSYFPIQDKGYVLFSYPETILVEDAECIRDVVNLYMRTMDRIASHNQIQHDKEKREGEVYYGA